jgi:hypothetical protein
VGPSLGGREGGRQDGPGPVRCLDLRLLVVDRTTAPSARAGYRPIAPTVFSANAGPFRPWRRPSGSV